MYKILNILMIILITFFISIVLKYYASNKNIKNKDYIRSNIEQIFKDKIIDIPILKNDKNNVIEFNDTFENEMNEEKKRSFWDLIKK